MKAALSRICLLSFFSAAALFSGCGSSPESLAEDMISKMEELVEVLETVKDEDTATDAVEDIKAIIADLKELKEEGEELEKSMSDEEQKALEEKFEPRLKKVMGKMMGEMMRVGLSPYGKAIQEAFQDFDM